MAEEIPVAPAPESAPVAPVSDAPAPAILSDAPAALSVDAASTPPVSPEPVPEGAKPLEAPPPAEPTPPVEAAAPADGTPEPIKYAELLKTPDGLVMAPEQMTAYSEILGKHNLSPEVGQELMDFGAGFIKQAQDAMAQRQQDVFVETRRNWVQDAQKKFGNKFDTTVNDAKYAITQLVPDAKARAELWNVLAFTGAGDHPAVVQAFAAAAKRLRERGAPVKGLPLNGAKSGSPAERRYGGKP